MLHNSIFFSPLFSFVEEDLHSQKKKNWIKSVLSREYSLFLLFFKWIMQMDIKRKKKHFLPVKATDEHSSLLLVSSIYILFYLLSRMEKAISPLFYASWWLATIYLRFFYVCSVKFDNVPRSTYTQCVSSLITSFGCVHEKTERHLYKRPHTWRQARLVNKCRKEKKKKKIMYYDPGKVLSLLWL